MRLLRPRPAQHPAAARSSHPSAARRSLPAGREGCAPPTTTSVRPLHRLLPPCASARSRAAARSCSAAARSPRALLSQRVLCLTISMASTQQNLFGAASPQFLPLASLSGSCGSRAPFRRPILGYRFCAPTSALFNDFDGCHTTKGVWRRFAAVFVSGVHVWVLREPRALSAPYFRLSVLLAPRV